MDIANLPFGTILKKFNALDTRPNQEPNNAVRTRSRNRFKGLPVEKGKLPYNDFAIFAPAVG
jgi:hypothetical protein